MLLNTLTSSGCFRLSILLITNSWITLFTLRLPYAAVPGDDEDPQCNGTSKDTVTMCWHRPRTNGGLPITDYVIEIREIGTQIWTPYVSPLIPHHTRRRPWRPQCGRGQNEKCAVFKFKLSLYCVPGRFSLRLTRLCQVLTTFNTFPLISYHAHYHARTTSNAFLLQPIRSHHVLNTHLRRSHCVHPILINAAPRAAHFHSFC